MSAAPEADDEKEEFPELTSLKGFQENTSNRFISKSSRSIRMR